MKAVAIQAFGNPAGLAVIELPDPSPAEGQVLITTEAIGVGGVDALIRSGAVAAYGFQVGHRSRRPSPSFPFRPACRPSTR